MFACLECGKRFRTVNAARRATLEGCPNCGGVDIDEAPPTPAEEARHQKVLALLRQIDARREARK